MLSVAGLSFRVITSFVVGIAVAYSANAAASDDDGGRKLASYRKSVSATSIGGIGDDAYYFGTDKLVSLVVKKGSVAFKVAVYVHMPAERQLAAEKALALQIDSQL